MQNNKNKIKDNLICYIFNYEDSKVRVIENTEEQIYEITAKTNGKFDIDKAIEFVSKYIDVVNYISLENKGVDFSTHQYGIDYFNDSTSIIDKTNSKVLVKFYKAPELLRDQTGKYYLPKESYKSHKEYIMHQNLNCYNSCFKR